MLKITLVQSNIHWESPTANRAMLEEKLWATVLDTDIVILPEMFTTGFSMQAKELAEPMNLTTTKWLKQMASQFNALFIGSIIIKENNFFYNRLLAVYPDGTIAQYDKRHLFQIAGESDVYTKGTERLIINYKGWNICPLICYDLRFPVWSRNINQEYDLLIYIANWPTARIEAWNTLLKARAIENLCYVAGVNIISDIDDKINYNGNSCIWDYQGASLAEAKSQNTILTSSLSKKALYDYRAFFPALLDADSFNLSL
jgi:omega-amidase